MGAPEEQPIKTFNPFFTATEDLTEEDLQARYKRTKVDPEFERTDEYFTAENRLLYSYTKKYGFAFPFTNAFDITTSQVFPAQWRAAGFTLKGSKVEFLDVRYETPRANNTKIFPSFSTEHREHSYSGKFSLRIRITDPHNNVLDEIVDNGLLPIFVGSTLCNLHPSNIDWETEMAEAPKDYEEHLKYTAAEEELTHEQRVRLRLDNFYRRHAQCTFGHVAYMVVNQLETVGINIDAQRTGVRQVMAKADQMCGLRFISTELITSSIEVFVPESKRVVNFPTIQMHNADFMRGVARENFVNIFVPFVFAGWSYERVIEEALRFTSDDSVLRNMLVYELTVSWHEFEALMVVCKNDLYGHLRAHMRDKGRNPITGRGYTDEQLRYFFIKGLFTHYEMPADGQDNYKEVLEETFTAKLRMLLFMTVEMKLRHFCALTPADKDDWSLKKIVTIVKTMQNLMAKHALEVRRHWIRKLLTDNILADVSILDVARFKSEFKKMFEITKTFERSLSGKSLGVFMPLTQMKPKPSNCHEKLVRESLISSIARGRKTRKPVSAQSKGDAVRTLNTTGTDTLCPGESSPGNVIGLLEILASTTMVSTYCSERPIIFLLRTKGYFTVEPTETNNVVLIVGGVFLGWCESNLQHILREMKCNGVIYRLAAIVYTTDMVPMIDVILEEGRLLAPMLIVNPVSGCILADELFPGVTDFSVLEEGGCVEFIDAVERKEKVISYDRINLRDRTMEMIKDRRLAKRRLEESVENVDVAQIESLARVKKRRKIYREVLRISRIDYVNLDPSTSLGASVAICPNVNNNSTVRAGFSAGQMKGAVSKNVSNPQGRTDVSAREPMSSGETSFHTVMGDVIGREAHYTSPIPCLVTLDAAGQEDSGVLDEWASQAGLGAFWARKRKDFEETETLRFGIAPGKAHYAKYEHIDPLTGFPRQGAILREGAVVVAMTLDGVHPHDVTISNGDVGTVDVVHVINKGGANRRVFIMMIVFHVIVEGHKLCAVESQKCVLGELRPRYEMPMVYGKPHMRILELLSIIALNGRMTVSTTDHLKYGRMPGICGQTPNATAFTRFDPSRFERDMINAGFRPNGMEKIMYPDGTIAKKRGFVGVMSIAVLSHYSSEKIHARGTGPRELPTDQPVVGRNFLGGLRCGYMEVTQLTNWGCTAQLHERLHTHADKRTLIYCQSCNARVNTLLNNGIRCHVCQHDKFFAVDQPFVILYFEALISLLNIEIVPTLVPVFSGESKSASLKEGGRKGRKRERYVFPNCSAPSTHDECPYDSSSEKRVRTTSCD